MQGAKHGADSKGGSGLTGYFANHLATSAAK